MKLDQLVRGLRLFGPRTLLDMAVYPIRKAYHTARFAPAQPRGPALWLATWRNLCKRTDQPMPAGPAAEPGPVRSHAAEGRTVRVACANAALHITILAADLIRVALQRPGEPLDTFSYAVAKTDDQWPHIPFDLVETAAACDIRTSRLVCRIEKATALVSFLDPQRGDAEISSDAAPMSWRGPTLSCRRTLPADEHVYGLGEKAFGLDRRGRAYEMWNDDPHAYPPGKDPLYLNIPLYIGLRGTTAYAVFFDNTYRGRFDVGASKPDITTFSAQGGPLRYYFFYGPQVSTILERYTELTGRLRLPPLWALGYHQSRWSYSPDAQVRAIARQFRSRRIPCDVIHLDIHYMDGYRCFTFHPRRFPDPAGLMASLHQDGFKVVTLIDCGIKADPADTVCADGLAHHAFCTYPDGALFRGPVWPGDCYFPDFTSPQARAWWGRQYQRLLDVGVDGIWNDMNEPTILGSAANTFPDCVRHDWEGRGADHAQAHNVYGMQMARATAEGLQTLRPDQRTFVITRSAWAGVQRFAMNWTGDNQSTWEHLRLTMPMVMSLGLCGLAFTGPDTGGFAGDAPPELLTRWLQLGAFIPFFRNHCALGNADQEPWVHGEPYESINRRSIELRYQLLPYLYTAFHQCASTGLPIMRPLLLDWQDDPHTHTLDDEFMCGDALLIAPVAEAGATRRNVYLPAGGWYDWWTGECVDGPQTVLVDAPLERLPIFARAGSVVPAWPVIQYVGEAPVDVLTLHVFPGAGTSMLYEDDGATLAYQRGEVRTTVFTVRSDARSVTVERTVQGNDERGYRRVELVVHGLDYRDVQAVSADGQFLTSWRGEPSTRTVHVEAPLAELYEIRLGGEESSESSPAH